MPAALAGYAPVAGATGYVVNMFAVYGQTALPTYSSMLPLGSTFVQAQCGINTPAVPPLPGFGKAMIVVYAPETQC